MQGVNFQLLILPGTRVTCIFRLNRLSSFRFSISGFAESQEWLGVGVNGALLVNGIERAGDFEVVDVDDF